MRAEETKGFNIWDCFEDPEIAGVLFEHEKVVNLPDEPITPGCHPWVCSVPESGSPSYEVLPPGCDGKIQSCTVRLKVPWSVPGTHQFATIPSQRVRVLWFLKGTPDDLCFCPAFPCEAVAECGLGVAIQSDIFNTWAEIGGLTCANLLANPRLHTYSASAYNCRDPGDVCNPFSCQKITHVPDLNFSPPAVAAAIQCINPPMSSCPSDNSCSMCRQAGDGGASAGGGGGGASPAGSGPGPGLGYTAGGAGGTGLPGNSALRASFGLGRFWSHPWSERIVLDPDDSHVWLITRHATFREFKGLSGGAYTINAPTDEYRTLTRTGSGWELRDLDGTRTIFRADGGWEETIDRNGNTTAASYNVGTGLLEGVSFPDLRSLAFTYHPDGKLATITEVGVAAALSRTWSYTWTGQDLTRIDRPDGTSWLMEYSNPTFPGYMTLLKLRATDAQERVVTGWEYDAVGNVSHLWSGAATHTDPSAVNHWQLAFNDPRVPTVTTVTDPLGAMATLEINRDTRSLKPKLVSTTGDCPGCGLAADTTLTYDDSAHPLRATREISAEGSETTTTFDSHGLPLTRTEVLIRTPLATRLTEWQYDADFPAFVTLMRQVSTSGTGFRETLNVYDPANGNLLQRTETGKEATYPGGVFSLLTTMDQNAAGQVTEINPPGYGLDDRTLMSYDPSRGNLVPLTRTDPLVGTTIFEHDAFNRRTRVIDPNNVTASTEYDLLNRTLESRQEDTLPTSDLVTTYEYTVFKDLFRTTLPEGNLIEYGYDSAGRLISVERKLDAGTPGERMLYTLNDAGNRTKEERQSWNGSAWVTASSTEYQYLKRCQVAKILHPDGTATEHDYDCDGRLKRVWDENHPSAGQSNPATQTYSYDLVGRLTSVTQPWTGAGGGSAVTSYQYDIQDHLTRVTDAEGNITSYVYSDRGLMTREVMSWMATAPSCPANSCDPGCGCTQHSYNDHGELLSTTDARPVTMTRVIDAADRLTKTDYPGTTLDIDYIYDDPLVPFSKGRLTAITRNGAAIDYRYDRFGRATQDGDLQYTYDANSNRTSIVYPGGITASYTHDFADREASLTVSSPGNPSQNIATAATYLPFGPLTGLSLGNTLTETRLFDSRYRPDRVRLLASATPRLDWDYTLDGVGNPTSIADLLGGPARTFAYQDIAYFLTQGDGPWGTRSWTYDRIGNRKTEVRSGITDTYVYATNGTGGNTPKLNSVALGGAGTRTYGYLASGHVTTVAATGNTVTFTTDDASRTSKVERLPGLFTDFSYDGRDFLTQASGESPAVQLLYPPQTRGVPGTLLFEDGFESGDACEWTNLIGTITPPCPKPTLLSATPTYSSDGVLRHLFRDNLSGQLDIYYFHLAGRPIAQLEIDGANETFKWLTTDHLGTPVAATNAAGAVLWSGGFEAFGADWNNAAGANIDLRLPGQWTNAAWEQSSLGVAIYQNVHRWYENQTGRYTRPDPWGVDQPSGISHLFSYGQGNPNSFIDPEGLSAFGALFRFMPDWNDALECFYCLLDRANYGFDCSEQAAWLTLGSGGAGGGLQFGCQIWAPNKTTAEATFRGVVPGNLVGQAHTHPTRCPGTSKRDPKPSRSDRELANRKGIPVYTISPDGVWVFTPHGKKPERVTSPNWTAEQKKRGCKPCDGM